MDSGGGWGGDRAPFFDRRELDRVPPARTSTTQPVGTVHTTHSNQNDPSRTRDARQPGNGGHAGRRAKRAANATQTRMSPAWSPPLEEVESCSQEDSTRERLTLYILSCAGNILPGGSSVMLDSSYSFTSAPVTN